MGSEMCIRDRVVDACLHLLRNPEASIDELMEIVPAPDFPTAGIIYGINGVKDGYRTGRGRVVMRAKCHFEDIDRGQRQAIIVDELPYQVNKKTLQERMADLVHEKKIEGISHIQDESDKSGMRLVIELKRGEVPEVVLNNLYKQTQLQDTFGINMVALINGQPKLCNLRDLIEVFLDHRREVVTRRTVFNLRKARERGHVLEGLAVALANIDDFIAIIRNAPTPPVAKTELMARSWDSKLVREMLTRSRADGGVVNADDYRPEGMDKSYGMGADGLYRLSDTQAQEILQMRLQRLTGLEQDKIVAEYKDVMSVIEDLLDILAKPERVSTIIGEELTSIKQEFGQHKLGARRSIVEYSAQDLSTEDLITQLGIGEALVTMLNEKGIPTPLAHTMLCAPRSRMDVLTEAEIGSIASRSKLVAKYNKVIDSESAYEILTAKLQEAAEKSAQEGTTTTKRSAKEEPSTLEKVTNNTIVKSMARTAGNTIVRSLLGALGLGGRSRSRKSSSWF